MVLINQHESKWCMAEGKASSKLWGNPSLFLQTIVEIGYIDVQNSLNVWIQVQEQEEGFHQSFQEMVRRSRKEVYWAWLQEDYQIL